MSNAVQSQFPDPQKTSTKAQRAFADRETFELDLE